MAWVKQGRLTLLVPIKECALIHTWTQQNASSSEELATSAEELSSQADQLKQVTSFFKLIDIDRKKFQNKEQKKID